MSDASPWPGGARATLSLSFDNLGEAAELELGAIEPGAPPGNHFTATETLPALLDRLDERGIAATFFVEGINAEIYPELLREIAARGHELALHAWRHEQWGELSSRRASREPGPLPGRLREAGAGGGRAASARRPARFGRA